MRLDEYVRDGHDHDHSQNRFAVIPTADKLNSDPGLSGENVTIAFLDSGFFPHPDFQDRVAAFHDIHGKETSFTSITQPQGHHWHGTQTVVACAGDGSLSDGIYRGLAHRSNLVLVKVSDDGRITDRSIEAGLEWILRHRERYGIRVLNMSLGGDSDLPLGSSRINLLTEELIENGVVVIVAAGNSAETRSIPPANSPSAITVGGYSDENQFAIEQFDLYHSSHGITIDGIVKPEIIAPAMWVAAPILPNSEDYRLAETLSLLDSAPDYQLAGLLRDLPSALGLELDPPSGDPHGWRQKVEVSLRQRKIVSTHYQHVDGTSFAAPITASVVAQMIETNPSLTPAAIKNILISTATRLGGRPSMRQGFGVVNAAAAVSAAKNETHDLAKCSYFPPRVVGREIVFTFHDDGAGAVSLCGDFNGWSENATPCRLNEFGLWQAAIRCLPAGRYLYKFVVDRERWTEDPSHGFKEDDGHGGFNSVLTIG